MLKRNSFNVHWKFGACQKWQRAGRIGDFGNFLNSFAKSPRVLRTVLNIQWVQFVLKNCENCILSEVCMIKTAPHIIKIRPDLFSTNLFSRPNLQGSRATMAIKCDRRWLLFFGCIYTGYQFDVRFFFTLKSLSLSFP